MYEEWWMKKEWERFAKLRKETLDCIGKILKASGGDCHKSYEGTMDVTFTFPECFVDDPYNEEPSVTITLYCYIIGPTRRYEYRGKNFAEALTHAEKGIHAMIEEVLEELEDD